MGDPCLRGDLSFVVLDGEEIAGYTVNFVVESDWEAAGVREGWVGQLGVRRPWRRRGVGRRCWCARWRRSARPAWRRHAGRRRREPDRRPGRLRAGRLPPDPPLGAPAASRTGGSVARPRRQTPRRRRRASERPPAAALLPPAAKRAVVSGFRVAVRLRHPYARHLSDRRVMPVLGRGVGRTLPARDPRRPAPRTSRETGSPPSMLGAVGRPGAHQAGDRDRSPRSRNRCARKAGRGPRVKPGPHARSSTNPMSRKSGNTQSRSGARRKPHRS